MSFRSRGRNACCTPCSSCATRDTQRVYRLYDFSKAQLIRPGVADYVPGKVNGADKLYLVIESVRLDRKPRRVSTAPVFC
jgi:hypothetical protein